MFSAGCLRRKKQTCSNSLDRVGLFRSLAGARLGMTDETVPIDIACSDVLPILDTTC